MTSAQTVWVRICSLEELPNGQAVNVFINSQRYVVARCEEQVFLTQGYCSHMLYPLKGAKVENCVLTCNLHGSQFNLQDGRVVYWPLPATGDTLKRKALKMIDTKVDQDKVYMQWPGNDAEKVKIRF
jgi:3-phenylpropionate/trans-cinnamate dioxygenase ferredoxin subunit